MGASAIARRTTAVSAVGTTWAAFVTDGTWDLTLAATAGDVIEVGVGVIWVNAAVYTYLDVATMVSGSPVNWVSTGTGSHSTGMYSAFNDDTNDFVSAGGSVFYTVQSGDISGGNITLRVYGKTSSSTRNLNIASTTPAVLWASKCDNAPVTSSLTGTLTSTWAVLTGTATVTASAGDVIACTVSAILNPNGAPSAWFDAATYVSGSPVNYFSTATSSVASASGWRCAVIDFEPVGGTLLYTVQSGDVSSGQVTVRMWGRTSSSTRALDSGSLFTVRKV